MALARYIFFILTAIYLLTGIGLVLCTEKGVPELWVNAFHTSSLDVFFSYYTFAGDGVFAAVIIAAVMATSYASGMFMLVAILFKTLIVQYLKNVPFKSTPRPMLYFHDRLNELHFAPGVEVYQYHSFPSGHTSTAFVLASCLVLLYGGREKPGQLMVGILLFFYAFMVAFSRIYLLQHFLWDTVAGTFIGVFCVLLVYALLWKRFDKLKGGLFGRRNASEI